MTSRGRAASAREGDPLLLAARELARQGLGQSRVEADPLEEGRGRGPGGASAVDEAVRQERLGDDGAHPPARVQGPGVVLEDELDLAPGGRPASPPGRD